MVDLLRARPGRGRSRGVGVRPGVAASARASGAPPQIYYCFVDKESLVRVVVEDQNERIGRGQEPMLAGLDSLGGIGPQARAAPAGGLLLGQVQRGTEPLEVALGTVIDYLSSLTVPEAS